MQLQLECKYSLIFMTSNQPIPVATEFISCVIVIKKVLLVNYF